MSNSSTSVVKSNPVVKKSNVLARARWSPSSLWEPRLVALVASKIKWEDQDFQIYKIHVSELFGEKYGGKDFEELEAAVTKCMGRVITMKSEKGWTKYTIFTKCEFIRDEGMLTLQFHPDLKPHYLNLKRYVKYSLSEFLALPSVYSQRLFEVLKSWADKPEVVISLSDLHEMIGVPDSMKKDFAQFRLRVLEKAKTDIQRCVNFCFGWEAIKTGRTVTDIRFKFSRKGILALNENKVEKEKEKQRKKNQKLWNIYFSCWQERGESCVGGYQKEEVCVFCLRMRPQA